MTNIHRSSRRERQVKVNMRNEWLFFAAVAAASLAITGCAGATNAPTVTVTDNLILCPNGLPDCLAAPAARCSTNPRCTAGYCTFTPTSGSTCLPPDVSFCDPGGHPECNRSDGTYPPDASACGTKECVATNSVCSWATCAAPAGH
jgi:hypothetical protein